MIKNEFWKELDLIGFQTESSLSHSWQEEKFYSKKIISQNILEFLFEEYGYAPLRVRITNRIFDFTLSWEKKI